MATSILTATHAATLSTTLTSDFGPTTPPAIVGPRIKGPTRPTKQLPQSLIDEARSHERVPFNPSKHLNIVPPGKIYSMKEIGLEGQGISPNAVSEPFSIFTPDAVRQMRAEIFSQPVLDSCQYSSDFAKNMIRGFGPKYVYPHYKHYLRRQSCLVF